VTGPIFDRFGLLNGSVTPEKFPGISPKPAGEIFDNSSRVNGSFTLEKSSELGLLLLPLLPPLLVLPVSTASLTVSTTPTPPPDRYIASYRSDSRDYEYCSSVTQ
jgi:hypothetical protein